jgi:hypothetical protein
MRIRPAAYLFVGLIALGLGLVYLAIIRPGAIPIPAMISDFLGDTETVEVTEYNQPQPSGDDELVDDELSTKNPAFVPDLIDRRPEGGWRINASSAVLQLDTPMLKPDFDAALLVLRPSYADAIASGPSSMKVLPSINLIDGKAKQFDDGLVAALHLAYYRGWKPNLESHVAWIQRLYERVGPRKAASLYLEAGLGIAGVDVEGGQPDHGSSWITRFESDLTYSKPFGFYTWSDELTRVFRFVRFFQQPIPSTEPAVIKDLGQAIQADPNLLSDYRKLHAFSAKLTNPRDGQTLLDVIEKKSFDGTRPIALFPSARSRETELFRRLFPSGLAPDADLMRALIRAIRDGTVDLSPRPESGWYDHQVYALETFLLPQRGEEHAKLLLTKAYKKRMLEAFAALITKQRETHSRDLAAAKSAEPFLPPVTIKPRLRVEPCPTYYLRMARSYDFLWNVLLATIGEKELASLHGLKEGGERGKTLLEELRWMREFFYGLHLLSAEDIGLAPLLRGDEPVDRAACEAQAAHWLASYTQDADLKVDARVSVPLYFDVRNRRTRLWATVGVRLAKLDVSYARPPKIKPAETAGEWAEVERHQLENALYLIAVDEFAEVEVPGLQPLTRKEFRDACNAHKTKGEILEALRDRPEE